jgi:hypothetical protein
MGQNLRPQTSCSDGMVYHIGYKLLKREQLVHFFGLEEGCSEPAEMHSEEVHVAVNSAPSVVQ